MTFSPRNPDMDAILAFWSQLDPKPMLTEFVDLCAQKGWAVKRSALSMWRSRGLLAGELPKRDLPRPRTAEELDAIRQEPRKLSTVVNTIVKQAEGDAREAAAVNVVYSKELLQETAAKSLMCAQAFIERVGLEAKKIKIENPGDLATVATVGLQVLAKVAEVSEALQLLYKSEEALDTARSQPTSLEEWRGQQQARGSAGKA